jgi:hypothetical protein
LPHLREFALDEEHIVDRPSLLIWGRLQIPLVRRSMATSGGTAQVGLQSEG